MITDLIINAFLAIPYLLLNSLSALDFSLSLPTDFFKTLNSLAYGIGFVLPVSGLLPIAAITLGLQVFQIAWAIILRIKSFIPTMGA